jgi:homoserine/homoserine lactone efflux protein
MTLEIAILFAMTEFLLSISPGPAVLLVVSRSMHYGAGAGLRATMGVTMANILFYCLSAAGIGAAILASHQVFLLIKWAGAAYLVWLGLTMLWPVLRGKATAPDMLSAHKPPATGRAFAHGFLIQISNPKNLIAFTAIIPQFVTPGPDIAMQFFILALITIAVEVPILAAYAALSSKASRWGRGKTTVWIEAIAGGWLIAAGAGLAAWRRIEP